MEGVRKMNGLGDAIYERGIERGIEQGIERGIEQGELRMLVSLVKDGLLTTTVAAKKANMSEMDFLKLMQEKQLVFRNY